MAKLTFGEKLADLREKKGITQRELAEVLGVNPRTVGSYESNRMKPLFDKLVAIGNYFNVSYDYLITTEDYDQVVQVDYSQTYVVIENREYSLGWIQSILCSFDMNERIKVIQLLRLLKDDPSMDIVGLAEIINKIKNR